ncbi:hypothetical protein E4U21_004920 [Claviceps maximensis]|nr:hypothetical protein E4U21_004920 [Claviceps maximensis]
MGVEADVWLPPDKTKLLVGYQASDLTDERTLQSLHLDPIKQIPDKLNPRPKTCPIQQRPARMMRCLAACINHRPKLVGTGNLGLSNDVMGIGCDALSRYSDTFLDAPVGLLTNASNSGTLPSCRGADSFLGIPMPSNTPHLPPFRTTSDLSSPLSATASAGPYARPSAPLRPRN